MASVPDDTSWAALERAIFPEEQARSSREHIHRVRPEAPCLILVVDDDADMRAYIGECLGDICRILEAADGEAALQVACRHRLSLVVSDVVMPRLDGYALCRALQADPALRQIPVLLISGEAAVATERQARAAGAAAFLAKPFNAHTLVAAVAGLLPNDAPG